MVGPDFLTEVPRFLTAALSLTRANYTPRRSHVVTESHAERLTDRWPSRWWSTTPACSTRTRCAIC
ncbi:hypothetical protein FMEAI12_5290054 [Parafrankia sp. Ea1.12]|nr:hypothetical protein FMEAI12_5290054 [Parafrankia sp. Ea1.12]